MFTKDSLAFLEKLLNTCSPSGFEMEAAGVYREYLNKFADKTYTDVMGNTVGIINEKAPFRIMLAGHYDEIGFQATYITDNGLIYFRQVGGVDKITVPGTEIVICTEKGKIPGIIGKKPIHLTKQKDRDSAIEIHDLWIDIGSSSKKETEKIVTVGDPITIKPNYKSLLGSKIISKGLDDKIGAFTAVETLKNLASSKLNPNIGVYCVGTTQEEVGLRGAKTSSFQIDPAVGFAIDVGFATDTPDINAKEYGDIKLGKGPILSRNADENRVLGKKVRDLAKKHKIMFQHEAGRNATGGTDTAIMQLSRSGVATLLVGIPTRYMHTQVEICDLKDVENAVKLLTQTILSITPDESFVPL